MSKTKTKPSKWISLILWYLPILAVQVISTQVTFPSIPNWYTSLIKPGWNPPNWVFGPVWTALYILMAISIWLIYNSSSKREYKNRAYLLFWTQLILNGAWSALFFGCHLIGWAAIDLGLLVIVVIAKLKRYYLIKPSAAFLQIPYLIWLLYAFTLNLSLWLLNT